LRSLKAMAKLHATLWVSFWLPAVALADSDSAGNTPADGTTKKKAAPKVTDSPKFKMAMWRQISRTGPQVDRCTAKYLSVNPGSTGSVDVWFSLAADGRVARRRLKSSLRGQDRLLSCLTDVTRQWRFPSIGTSKVDSAMTVQVAEGVKFKMLKPGEKPPPDKARAQKKKKKDGFIRFSPGLPGGQPQVNVK
jgi:hypothetical protein